MFTIMTILAFILGISGKTTEKHLTPEPGTNSLLFNLGRIISYALCGTILGLLGFLLKINGFYGGILIFAFALGVFIVTISHMPILPKLVIIGLRRHHHPQHAFTAGLVNIFASSASLHITMIVALAHGYFLESGIILITFALGSLYLPGKQIIPLEKPFKVFKILIFLASVLFITNKGLLYTELYLFSPLEYNKAAIIPESLNNTQFLRTETGQFDKRIVISGTEPLNWMIEKTTPNNRLYIPRYKHKSILGSTPETLNIGPVEPGFIYFTGELGQGDYIIRILPEKIDAFSMPYRVVLDSGYEFGIHEAQAEIELPEIHLVGEPGIAIESDGRQYIDINVTESGYSPNVIVIKKGVPTTINFEVTTLTEENKRIIMPSYNEFLEFIPGSNPINITDPLIDFLFYDWKRLYGGFILVVDNPGEITKEQVIRQIKMFNVNGI